MMKHTKFGGIATALLALALSASAEIKLNDNISTSGYIAGSYQLKTQSLANSYYAYWSPSEGRYKSDSLDLDSAKVAFDLTYKPVTAKVSFLYVPAWSSVTMLDANATYDTGKGLTVTGGKFLSSLGFESYDVSGLYQVSYANNDFLGAIPGYQEGIRAEYTTGSLSTGLSIVDSVYSWSPYRGDGEFRYNQGYEAYVRYTGIKDLTLFAGVGFQSQTTNETENYIHDDNTAAITTVNVWGSYQFDPSTLIAAEFTHKNGEQKAEAGYNWLFLTNRKLTEKFSVSARFSGEHMEGFWLNRTSYIQMPNFTKVTIAPAYELTKNLILRGEVSYFNYANYKYEDKDSGRVNNLNHSTYFGLRAIFQF